MKNHLPYFCRNEATRTPDPYVPNVVRYQLRYIPIIYWEKVVPPGIEPFVSVYSNPLSDCTFVTLSFIKAIELALH